MKPTKKKPIRKSSLGHKPPQIPVYTIGKSKRWKREYVNPTIRTGASGGHISSSPGATNFPSFSETPHPRGLDLHFPESSCTPKTHSSRVQQLVESWQGIHNDLRKTYYASQAPRTKICCMCGVEEEHIIICLDCGPTCYYCTDCSKNIHRNAVLHIPKQWKGKFFVDIDHGKKFHIPWHQCDSTTENWIKVIDCLGRPHDVQVPFCACHSKAVTLVKLNLWPGSPVNPQMAFDMRLMTLSRSFLLEAHVSLQAFCSSVQHAARQFLVTQSQVNMYRVLVNECAAQFRRFSYDIAHLVGVCDHYPDGTDCPLCVTTQHQLPRLISVDGNFRLVRKKSAGKSPQPGHHEGRMFLPDLPPLQSQSENVEAGTVQTCSEFKAGDLTRSKLKSQRLDVSGVFGSICIHDYPRRFIDMNSGESLKYAIAVLKEFPAGTPVKFLYDIGCRLHSHLKSKADPVLETTSFAVPLFHGYAHNSQCQMAYNPRRQKDLRMADGENMERLWSVMDSYAYMSREMTPSRRKDLLVDVLIHIGETGIAEIERYFTRRYSNAVKVHAEAKHAFESTMQELTQNGYRVDQAVVRGWKTVEEEFFLKAKGSGKTTGCWKEDYAVLLKKWYNALIGSFELPLTQQENSLRIEIQSLDDKLRKFEKKQKFSRWSVDSQELKSHLQAARGARRKEVLSKLHREATERCHILVVKKHARGYDAVTRMAGLLKKVNATITRLVRDYNHLADLDCEETLTFDDVKTSSSEIYKSLTPISTVPYHIQRKAVDSVCMMDRSVEEMDALKLELHGLFTHYQNVKESLRFSLAECSEDVGLYSLLFQHLVTVERRQLELKGVAGSVFHENVHIDTPFLSEVVGSMVLHQDSAASEQDLCLELLEGDEDNDIPTDDEL